MVYILNKIGKMSESHIDILKSMLSVSEWEVQLRYCWSKTS